MITIEMNQLSCITRSKLSLHNVNIEFKQNICNHCLVRHLLNVYANNGYALKKLLLLMAEYVAKTSNFKRLYQT